MSLNRLGTLFAGVLGLGWLTAVATNLIFWSSQIQALPPDFWDDSGQFLAFVADNQLTWRVFHVGTTVGLMALVGLVGALAQVRRDDERWLPLTMLGLVGALLALLASLIDHLGTPVLARLSAGNAIIVSQVWQFMEPVRDAGMKTVSYYFMGAWVLWLGGGWLADGARRLGLFSRVTGVALLLLGLIETMTPAPLIYMLGETGAGGAVFLLLPVWGLWVARWFWQRELHSAEA